MHIIRALALATLALGAAAAATPPTAVSEDFSGSEFPPAGWTTEGSGEGYWHWSNAGGYAKGECFPAMYADLTTSLKSPSFHVSAGTRLHVRFRYFAQFSGEGAALHVYVGTWYAYIPYAESWAWYDADTDVYGTGGTLRGEWRISGNGGSHGNTGSWYIDDVLITRYNTAVAPASLGRIKALYR